MSESLEKLGLGFEEFSREEAHMFENAFAATQGKPEQSGVVAVAQLMGLGTEKAAEIIGLELEQKA